MILISIDRRQSETYEIEKEMKMEKVLGSYDEDEVR
jgi:hypothetical protein